MEGKASEEQGERSSTPDRSSTPFESIPLEPLTPKSVRWSSHLGTPNTESGVGSARLSPAFSATHSVASGILAVADPKDDKLDDWLPGENTGESDESESDSEPPELTLNAVHSAHSPSRQGTSLPNPLSLAGPSSPPRIVVDSPILPKKAFVLSESRQGLEFEEPASFANPFSSSAESGRVASWPDDASLKSASSDPFNSNEDTETNFYPDVPYGRTLFLFGTNHSLRKFCFNLWSRWYMKYVIDLFTLAQMIILTIETSKSPVVNDQILLKPPRALWSTWVYLIFYIIYTTAMVTQILAFGAFTVRVVDFSDLVNFAKAKTRFIASKLMILPERKNGTPPIDIEQRCFFRKSWNRIEFLSIVCFWTTFLISIFQPHPPSQVLRILAGIAHMRILRLLDIFAGTRIVLEALKVSIPLLRDALLFLMYFWIVYAIAGLRSFNSSLSRQCVWINPNDPSDRYFSSNICGGFYDPQSGAVSPAMDERGIVASRAKGFTCPAHSKCISAGNPESGTMSFDNIFNSLELVFIIMSQNTFSDIMYDVINAEYMVSSIFFISGVLVLNLWLINLLVAIMATSFQVVREKLPAFSSRIWKWKRNASLDVFSGTVKGKVYLFVQPIFLLLIVLDLVFQALWGGLWAPNNTKLDFLFTWEIITTVTLAGDVLFRIFVYLPRWRLFFGSLLNIVDTILAIVTVVILPFRDHKTVYGFLGFFPLLRFYRVVGSFKVARDMWLMVLGNYMIIAYLTIFYFATVFLASLIAAKIFQGGLPYLYNGEAAEVSFFDLSNSFMGMYQIATTENWSDVMFYATSNIEDVFSAACAAAFFCLWLFFSYFIITNMFVAVMTDNIVSRVNNHRQLQVEWFVRRYITSAPEQWRSDIGAGVMALVRTIARALSGSERQTSKSEVVNEELQRKIIAEFLASATEKEDDNHEGSTIELFGSSSSLLRPFDVLFKSLRRLLSRHPEGYSSKKPSRGSYRDDLDRYVTEAFTMRSRTETFVLEYGDSSPGFDRSLWIFGRNNKLRRLCQRIYPSAHGVRASGIEPSKWVWYPLSTFLIGAIILMVVFSCINTPIYQLSHSIEIGTNRRSFTWFVYMDIVFLAIFLLEFLIKIVADGFHYTPNAYTHSVWNVIDLIVLISMIVTLGIELAHGPSRFSRGLMALRALRLISMNPRSDAVFKSVFFSGLQQLLVACFIALGFIFPMSIWGKHMFRGRLESCNDSSIENFADCIGEYASSPYAWDVWAPRAVSNPYFDFDSFGHALFITFGVLSLEGWVDVLNSVMAITEVGMNPEPFYRRYNALFPILWNFLGTMIIMTLFIAIIVRNYSFAQGTAFMTKEQLSWKYTHDKFKAVKPLLKLPSWTPGTLRFKISLHSRGSRCLLNAIQLWCLIVLTVTMCIFHAPLEYTVLTVYFVLVILASFAFSALEALKMWANGWNAFRRAYSQWYSFLMSFILGLLSCFYNSPASTLSDLQSGFLVLVLTLWIPRVRRLKTLLSMATSNIWQIFTLMQTWFVLYLTWAIALNQIFGLTRIGPNSSSVQNFRTVPKALILLARMSSGENWNEILDDYLVSEPYCVQQPGFYETDCGDKTMAYILFTSWNIISMFIFANLFISLIYETFWPVFHRAHSKISDAEIEAFRDHWQLFDPMATGRIPYECMVKVLNSTPGYFKLAVYSDDPTYSVSAILKRADARKSVTNPYKVDWRAINQELEHLPVDHFKHKRDVFQLFCAHMGVITRGNKGVSFHKLMKTIPLYKDFDPAKSLSLKQFLKLRLTLHKARATMSAERLQSQWRLYVRQKRGSAADS